MTDPSLVEEPPARPGDLSDYAQLRRLVRDAGLLDRQPAFYVRSIIVKLALLVACLAGFVVLRPAWALALDAVALAIVFGQLGFQLHDAGHRQMFASGALNAAVGLLTGNLVLGMSYGWWVDKHNRHHANPNHMDLDPDIGPGVIAYSAEGVRETRGLYRLIARHQAYLFLPLLLFLAWSMHIAGLRYLFGQQARRRWLELGLLGLHLVLYVGFFVHFLGPWQALMVIVIHQCCGGFYMASVFAPNHKGMERLTSGHELDFLRRQVLTSRNVRAHPLTDVWYGALNYQVEHHLFPTMARNRVPRAHTIVADFCRERDIPYHQVSVLRSWREILSYLHQVGAPLRRPGGRGAGWLSLRPRRRAG